MKKTSFLMAVLMVLGLTGTALTSCDPSEYAEATNIIIEPASLSEYVGAAGTVIIDMQEQEDYMKGHIEGAVNIQISDVSVNLPVEGMLAPMGKIETVLKNAGISNDTLVVIYDEGGSLNSSRLWWSMLVYGHENVKVVSGGLPAIKAQTALELTADIPDVTEGSFTGTNNTDKYVATMKDVLEQVNNPDPNTILLDARSEEEYLAEGKIPSSIMFPHTKNFYSDGMLIDAQATRINYIEAGIRSENKIITYCKTSKRSATTFLLLYNAGYRNIMMYDGAFTEWSASGNNPIEIPEGAAVESPKDNS